MPTLPPIRRRCALLLSIVGDCELSVQIYTVSRDGALFVWGPKAIENEADDGDVDMADGQDDPENATARTRWGIAGKHYFLQSAKVTSSAFHTSSSILVVGFQTGVFGLWELSPPDGFSLLHTLSISQERVTSVAINPSGEWLAFGASKLGQLLVWEWQSESYVLKQQGHYADTNALAFSADGQHVATGGEDGKVKLWNATSAFCFVTFTEHTSAVTAVEFTKQGQVIFSASLDGTVRAFDLARYRNFRTFHAPTPVAFNALAVDPSGEIVCAAGTGAEAFDVFVWSTQTGKLVEVLTGHEGPVSSLAFSPAGDRVASCSWDRTARIWDLYGRSRAVEPLRLSSDALAVAYRPDGAQIAVSTLNGQIAFFDTVEGRQVGLIEGARDVAAGRLTSGAASGSGGRAFNSLAYSADGARLLAGGSSRWVCLYDVADGVLLKRWSLSENLDLEGTQDKLDSRLREKEGIDTTGDLSDLEDRLVKGGDLPGAVKNVDASRRKHRADVRANCVRLAPTGRSWAAAGTEGVLIYSLDAPTAALAAFDPYDLAVDVTPQAVSTAIRSGDAVKALALALRLAEKTLVRAAYESVPLPSIRLAARNLPLRYALPLLRFIAAELEPGASRHLELHLRWSGALLSAHGTPLRSMGVEVASVLRSLQKGLSDAQAHVAKLCVLKPFSEMRVSSVDCTAPTKRLSHCNTS